jgi:hypothetical protein
VAGRDGGKFLIASCHSSISVMICRLVSKGFLCQKKFLTITIIAILVVAAGIGIYFFKKKGQPATSPVQEVSESKETSLVPEPDGEGTCHICFPGSPCYDTPTTFSYCQARAGVKWCNKKGECIKL